MTCRCRSQHPGSENRPACDPGDQPRTPAPLLSRVNQPRACGTHASCSLSAAVDVIHPSIIKYLSYSIIRLEGIFRGFLGVPGKYLSVFFVQMSREGGFYDLLYGNPARRMWGLELLVSSHERQIRIREEQRGEQGLVTLCRGSPAQPTEESPLLKKVTDGPCVCHPLCPSSCSRWTEIPSFQGSVPSPDRLPPPAARPARLLALP